VDNAVIFCEGQFGMLDGKTANGLVRDSKKYRIVGVIDSTKAGKDAGEVLDEMKNGIKIYKNLEETLQKVKEPIQYFIYGIAPNTPFLPKHHRKVIHQAIENKLNIVIGLMNFLTEDSHIMKKAKLYGVKIYDVRKPPTKRKLHIFSSRIKEVDVPVIVVLGMDTAIGKRTTAMILDKALNDRGLKSVFVATGQTGLMQGAKYGVAMDAIPDDFLVGEVENAVVSAYQGEHPEIIIVEGQSALGHPGFIGSFAIVKGARPNGIILQLAPMRKTYCDFPTIPIKSVSEEIKLIETVSHSKVIGTTLNHEGMSKEETLKKIEEYEEEFGLPATDPLFFGMDKFIDQIIKMFLSPPKIRLLENVS